MRVVFQEVSIKAVKRWKDENGKTRQQSRKFFQTINPFNCDKNGYPKTRMQILDELRVERDSWLSSSSGMPKE